MQTVEYIDKRTGVSVEVLPTGAMAGELVPARQPMWTADTKYLIFQQRLDHGVVPYAYDVPSKKVVRLADAQAVSSWVLAPRIGRLYYLLNGVVHAINLNLAARKLASSIMVAPMPQLARAHALFMSMDASENYLYAAVEFEPVMGRVSRALVALDLHTDEWQKVIDLDFLPKYIIANPNVPGIVALRRENADSDLPLWLVRRAQRTVAPLATPVMPRLLHETWWGPSRLLLTCAPKPDKPASGGVFSVDLFGKEIHHVVYPLQHVDGNPASQLLVADDIQYSLWLVQPKKGERRLLSSGHGFPGAKVPPRPSFSPDGRLIAFNTSHEGQQAIAIIKTPEMDVLPAPTRNAK